MKAKCQKPDRSERSSRTWRIVCEVRERCTWSSLSRTCPAIVPQFFTTWAHHAQYATQTHAFLLSFFVTIETKGS